MENPADRAAGATGTLMSARGHEKLLRNLRCQRMSTSPSSDCRRDDHGCRFVPNTPIMRPILGRRELVEIDPDHEFRLRQLPGGAPGRCRAALSLSRPRPARRTRPSATIRRDRPRPPTCPGGARSARAFPGAGRSRGLPPPDRPGIHVLAAVALPAGEARHPREGVSEDGPGCSPAPTASGPGPRALPGYCFRVA